MIDQTAVARVVGVAALLPSILLVGLFGAAIVARLRGRGVGRVWQRLFAASVGGHVGFALLIAGAFPSAAAVALFVAMVIGLWLVWIGRRTEAGWFAFAVAAPWTVLWGFYVVHLIGGADFEPYITVTRFLLGAVPTAIALIVALAGDPPPPEPRPDAPAGQPGSRQIGHIGSSIRAAMSVGPVTTMEFAGLASLWALTAAIGAASLPLPPLVQAVGLVAVGTILASEVAIRAAPSRVRRALEAISWLGDWEQEQARRRGLPAISSVRQAKGWLARTPERPDDRWVRWEALLLVGRLDEAAQVAARMPEDTPYQRFERIYAIDRVEWTRGAAGDPDAVREAAAAIGPLTDDDRLRAEVALALRESQRRAAAGSDAIAPLVEVRDRLGGRPDVRIGASFKWRMRQAMFVVAIITVAVVYLTDPIAEAIVDAVR